MITDKPMFDEELSYMDAKKMAREISEEAESQRLHIAENDAIFYYIEDNE